MYTCTREHKLGARAYRYVCLVAASFSVDVRLRVHEHIRTCMSTRAPVHILRASVRSRPASPFSAAASRGRARGMVR